MISSELRSVADDAKVIAQRYHRLTGKPLGVTGELAELEAADLLGLDLAEARTPGFDALRHEKNGTLRVQIKGRAVDRNAPYRGRYPSIKYGDQFDVVDVVLLDRDTLDVIEIWEATEGDVAERLSAPGSKARNERNSMGLSQFKSIAKRVWPSNA